MNQVTEDANAQLEQLRRSFEEKVGLIKNNTEDELQEMANTAQKVLTEAGWDETGKQIVKGLTEGVQSEKSSFVDEITQLALAGVQAAKSTLDIHSPSRVFREIGNYTGLGFVKGLQDYVDRAYAAGSEMAESAEGGLSGVLQTIADIVSGGFDMEPVIRPVLDLSAVSAGADALNNLFYSQRAVGLVGQAAVAFEAQRSGSSQTTISVDNDDVVAELRTLRGEMASMLERMEKLRVVLNTGALVGELAEPMDAALGQRSKDAEDKEGLDGFQYDEYCVEVESWPGLAASVRENYDTYLAKGKDNEVDRSNYALFRAQKNTDSIVQDTDAMSVDHEYRLTLLELGLSE